MYMHVLLISESHTGCRFVDQSKFNSYISVLSLLRKWKRIHVSFFTLVLFRNLSYIDAHLGSLFFTFLNVIKLKFILKFNTVAIKVRDRFSLSAYIYLKKKKLIRCIRIQLCYFVIYLLGKVSFH